MAGQIKTFIDQITEKRAAGNRVLTHTTHARLILKGIIPASYTAASPDQPAIVAQLRQIAGDLGVALG